ncbi:uncharacterized protein LOC122528395 [Frieseomelitta varia]|uniref:uncharacterized protein LOC122528395 n=1 Tax=Frieseomelitta varia TaxID=561572 RepID=UPI001CB6AD86|nr:uncharacterized protein LOC122528395 [Frieseomelitta varia]
MAQKLDIIEITNKIECSREGRLSSNLWQKNRPTHEIFILDITASLKNIEMTLFQNHGDNETKYTFRISLENSTKLYFKHVCFYMYERLLSEINSTTCTFVLNLRRSNS